MMQNKDFIYYYTEYTQPFRNECQSHIFNSEIKVQLVSSRTDPSEEEYKGM